MSRKSKYSIEDRVRACEDYINGIRSVTEICISLRTRHIKTVARWAKQYSENGAEVFYPKTSNKAYLSELKTNAVKEYLFGTLSMEDVCNKYNIYAPNTLSGLLYKQ